MLFDVHKDGSKMAPKWVAPESEQDEYESRRLWLDLTKAIANKDMEAATTAKSAVENAQRELRTKREALHARVVVLAVEGLGLPSDPETFFTQSGGREKGRVRSRSARAYWCVRKKICASQNASLNARFRAEAFAAYALASAVSFTQVARSTLFVRT